MKKTFLSHTEAAVRNKNMLLHYIKKNNEVSRTDIWEAFNISRGVVTEIIKQLNDNALIKEKGVGKSTGGRKPVFLVFDGERELFFSFSWYSQTLYLMNLNGKILDEERIDFPPAFSPEIFSQKIISCAENIMSKRPSDEKEILGLVFDLPGILDTRKVSVIYSIELGWQDVNLENLFLPFFKNIYLESVSNILALGELSNYEKQKNTHLQLVILDEHGIGVSTVIHGKLQHGAEYMHGELGHIKLPSDVLCSCGQKGCLEAIVSKIIRDNDGEISDEALDYLAIGVSTAVNICDTNILLVGSYVDKFTEEQKEYLCDAIRSRVTSSDMRRFDITFSYDRQNMAKCGLCEYMFERTFPLD